MRQTGAVNVRDGTIIATLVPQNYEQPTGVVDFLMLRPDRGLYWTKLEGSRKRRW